METYTQNDQLDWLGLGLLGWDGTYSTGNFGYAQIDPTNPPQYNFSFAVDWDDYDYIKRYGTPYDGMFGLALDTGDVYTWDGLHGFWSSIKSGFKKIGKGISSVAKKAYKGIKKVGGYAKNFIKKYGAALAPVVSLIPAVGPIIGAGLLTASAALKLYDKYKHIPETAIKVFKKVIKTKKKNKRKILARNKARKAIAARASAIAYAKAAKRRKRTKASAIKALVRKEKARIARQARLKRERGEWTRAKPGAWSRKGGSALTPKVRARPAAAQRVRGKAVRRKLPRAAMMRYVRAFRAARARQAARGRGRSQKSVARPMMLPARKPVAPRYF